MKIVKYILSIIIGAFGAVCILGASYYSFSNDHLTNMQVLKECWIQYLIGVICLGVSLKLGLLKEYKDL